MIEKDDNALRNKYYTGGKIFLVSLVFEWLRYESHLKKALEWNISSDDGLTDFFSVHFDIDKKSGLMVYGHIEPIKE